MIELNEAKQGEQGSCCTPALLMDLEQAKAISDDLTLLAHPIRLQILSMLARQDEKVCVCDLEAALPVKQPTVSHHLKILREAGLIDYERRGVWAYYFIQSEAMGALRSRVSLQLSQF